MINVAIFGAGGLGKEILALIHAINKKKPTFRVLGFYDDAFPVLNSYENYDILGSTEELMESPPEAVVLAIGSPLIKQRIKDKLKKYTIRYPILIHPTATLDNPESIQIGEGSIITAGCRLTCDIIVGKNVLVNLNATIGHDCTIGDMVSIMPGVNLAGYVTLGNKVFVGSGANIINNVMIGNEVTIGAGSVVIRNVDHRQTVAGVPAKILHI